MPREISNKTVNDQWRRKIAEISGENVHKCTQCATCAGSCPMNDEMQASPRKIMALVQFGQAEAMESVNSPWVCAACHTCVVRCPRAIDIAKVMEALRQSTLRTNVDHVELSRLQPEEIADMPTIAMVAGLRKFTS